jgi:hypothetical protein
MQGYRLASRYQHALLHSAEGHLLLLVKMELAPPYFWDIVSVRKV